MNGKQRRAWMPPPPVRPGSAGKLYFLPNVARSSRWRRAMRATGVGLALVGGLLLLGGLLLQWLVS
jgi:hypothetical protein